MFKTAYVDFNFMNPPTSIKPDAPNPMFLRVSWCRALWEAAPVLQKEKETTIATTAPVLQKEREGERERERETKKKMQLLRPLQYCRETETAITTTAQVLTRQREKKREKKLQLLRPFQHGRERNGEHFEGLRTRRFPKPRI